MLNVERLTRRRNGRMREVVNKIGDFRHWHWHNHQLTSPLPGHWAGWGRVTGKWKTWATLETKYTRRWIYGGGRIGFIVNRSWDQWHHHGTKDLVTRHQDHGGGGGVEGGRGIMIAQHWQLVITTKTVTAPLRTLARLHYWWYLARAQEAWEQRRHAVLRIMHSNDQSAVNWENAGTSGCSPALQHCSTAVMTGK